MTKETHISTHTSEDEAADALHESAAVLRVLGRTQSHGVRIRRTKGAWRLVLVEKEGEK